MKNVLITGGAGFIGSHFAEWMVTRYPKWKFIVVDSLTYAGNIENLASLEQCISFEFVKGDITDQDYMDQLFQKFVFDYVVHFAAQTHVDRSIDDPDVFIRTNVLGTHSMLEAARKAWQTGLDEENYPKYKKGVRFIQISTDEVYGQVAQGAVDENAPLRPSSPYSGSKAAADMIVHSYIKTYRFPAVITRSTNNFGSRQYKEKLIPLMIGRAMQDFSLPVYGKGQQKRDWIYVLDHCRAIEVVLLNGKPGEIYNIGAGNERTNMQIVDMILSALNKSEKLIAHTTDRPAHDQRYAVDTSKIELLGWKPSVDFRQTLLDTINWYIRKH